LRATNICPACFGAGGAHKLARYELFFIEVYQWCPCSRCEGSGRFVNTANAGPDPIRGTETSAELNRVDP
jgi:DnaJ-class molecular chaperone